MTQPMENQVDPTTVTPEGKEYNILLLGETGTGKSTTINGFANYLKYVNFDEAKENQFVELIPSEFTITNFETGEPVVISSGKRNTNELLGSNGKSKTQSPKDYLIEYGHHKVRMIDTPGSGDTGGLISDKKNFDNIIEHLQNFKQLHGILILLKSSETRHTPFFRYCFTELLYRLHKSACQNILFCFTYSRSSFYAPGDGFDTLKGFMQESLPEVAIELKPKENCFFIDNEAYRFLVAKKFGLPFPKSQELSFKESWDQSVQQTAKMMQFIVNNVPHELDDTIQLNNARDLIAQLAEPLVLLQTNVSQNISHLNGKKEELKYSKTTKKDLKKHLKVEVNNVKKYSLFYPMTVCTSSKCTDVVRYKGENKVYYKTRCHKDCQIRGVKVNTVGHTGLQDCWAMDGEANCAKKCGCSWQEHMHVTCVYKLVKRKINDTYKEGEIENVDQTILTITSAMNQYQELIKEYKQEIKIIQNVCAKFAYILVTNSSTSNNKFIEPYMELMIKEENKKISANTAHSRTTLECLEEMKISHQQNVRILKQAIESRAREQLQIRDVFRYKDKLLALKHCGPQFEQMLSSTKWNQIETGKKSEQSSRSTNAFLDVSKLFR